MPDTSGMTESEARAVFEGGFRQLHSCLESHRDETRGAFKAVTATLGELKASIGVNNGVTEALAKRLNVNVDVKDTGEVHGIDKVKAAVGAWSMKKALLVGLPLLSGFFLLLQFLFTFAPPVAKAFYDAVMAMPG